MFSGIVEAQSKALKIVKKDQSCQVTFQRPQKFDDIEWGHSIAVDGVCLTVESFCEASFTVTVGAETLRVTNWLIRDLEERQVNVERALKVGDRLHGHWVLGHVDGLAWLESKQNVGEETCYMEFSLPSNHNSMVWSKGSLALNGVSLTVNECRESFFSVALIPETMRRTNLGSLRVGESAHFELDILARGLATHFKRYKEGISTTKEESSTTQEGAFTTKEDVHTEDAHTEEGSYEYNS